MKRIIYLVTMLLLSVSAFSQVPQYISYQAVVRNSNNVLVTNSQVGVSISIVKDSANGTVVYNELHTPTTNANGLFSIAIGSAPFSSGKFSTINWSTGVYYIKSQIDPTGGLNFSITGTSQILCVPYAIYAANGTQSGNNVGDMQYWNGTKWVILPAGPNGSVLTISNGIPTWVTGSGTGGVVAPTVTTTVPSSITSSSALVGGNLTSNGGASVTSYGVCYATTTDPTTSNTTVSVGAGTGSFSTTITGLISNTTYYVRAYATNSAGTSYGSQQTLTTLSGTTPTYTVGESYGGGTIFYIDSTKQHGLIAAQSDAGGITPWDQSTSGTFTTTNAIDTTVGGGAANTTKIVAALGSGSYAANIASQTANGYSDWYLPSKGELELIFNNLTQVGLGNMTKNVYWSSSEYNTNQAWAQDFSKTITDVYTYWKSNSAYVRPIRKF